MPSGYRLTPDELEKARAIAAQDGEGADWLHEKLQELDSASMYGTARDVLDAGAAIHRAAPEQIGRAIFGRTYDRHEIARRQRVSVS